MNLSSENSNRDISVENPLFLKTLPKSELLKRTNDLAAEERRIGLQLLWHLREMDRRRLAEELGFSGVFDYCVKVLHFSEGSAYRRVQAMRALRNTPTIANALKDGRLTVTTASQVQTFLQRSRRAGVNESTIRERLARQTSSSSSSSSSLLSDVSLEKALEPGLTYEKELFSSFEGLSSREVERRLAELAPEIPRVERERAIGTQEVEIRVTLSTETRLKWNRIQELAAHRLRFDKSTRRLIELTSDITLDTLEKEKGIVGLDGRDSAPPAADVKAKAEASPKNSAEIPLKVPSTRFIPTAIRRAVWRRDEARCQYREAESQKNCESRFGLEVDHILPWSLGGSSLDLKNLRLLCAAHHRRYTEKTFGRRGGARIF